MKNNVFKVILKWLICAVIIFVGFWFVLPPINPRSGEMWAFLVFCIVVCVVVNAFSQIFAFFSLLKPDRGVYRINSKEERRATLKKAGKPLKFAVLAIVAIVVLSAVASVIGAQVFNASRYEKLITMENGDFTADVAEINRTQIPVVDRDTASRLGQRKLGEISDLVSQFVIEEDYTQINYKGKPVRVTPLAYGDIIKWFNNNREGIPAYITVDMTTQETSLVRLNEGIKYSESEYFMRNLYRYLRFKYPTKIFDNISFEIDEDGTPYWVASTMTFKIGFWSGRDIEGAVLLNAVTGESEYYKLTEIPTWVDQVYSSDMIMEQLIYNGKYRSGFFNSIFGQKGVLQPTDGYNYLAINDDVYLYTGITSVTSDESNVGFVLTNLRTKETKYYAIPGAEEYSAMDSAEGQVQHLKYSATFPLLLNISDRPTYFMSLKDGAGLVKMYAFVDVSQYQIVGTGSSVEEARADYISKLKNENLEIEDTAETTVSGIIENIASAVVSGNTNYYIKLNNDDKIYIVPITISDKLPLAKSGDSVEMTVSETEEKATVSKINFK
ncbi:MAG: CvpA family protein [Acutalibacteraceae bacterium]